jgi:hypothetical protein
MAVVAATLVLTSDVTAMAAALPTIERDLGTDRPAGSCLRASDCGRRTWPVCW